MESPPQITFDQLPAAIYQLNRKVDDLTGLLKTLSGLHNPSPDRWFSINELSEYLPGGPAVTTLYGKVQRQEIPFKRMGKRLVFLKSEIDIWLNNREGQTTANIKTAALSHIATPLKSGRKGGRKSVS